MKQPIYIVAVWRKDSPSPMADIVATFASVSSHNKKLAFEDYMTKREMWKNASVTMTAIHPDRVEQL